MGFGALLCVLDGWCFRVGFVCILLVWFVLSYDLGLLRGWVVVVFPAGFGGCLGLSGGWVLVFGVVRSGVLVRLMVLSRCWFWVGWVFWRDL